MARKPNRHVLTASQLRADVYRILDQVIKTGGGVEIERKGRRLRIVPVDPPSRLARLVARPDFIRGDPEELVRMDWSGEWRGRDLP